jgi:hypothetical protein
VAQLVTLSNDQLRVVVDPRRGGDVLQATHRASGIDVLATTPWHERAEAIRSGGMATWSTDPTAGALEGYAGGWNILCPSAGGARTVAGAPLPFHGEAWAVPWKVVDASAGSATLRVELYSVPLAIERTVALDDGTISLVDELTNVSVVPLDVDYVSHPALSTSFLDGKCTIDTGARRFTVDPDHLGPLTPGSTHDWPLVGEPDGGGLDLGTVPTPGTSHTVFGWLSDFDGHWACVTNHDLGLAVTLEWDGTHLPYAWWWQELNATEAFPWFKRARVMAIEPSSTPTGGPGRVPSLRVEGGATVTVESRLSVASR